MMKVKAYIKAVILRFISITIFMLPCTMSAGAETKTDETELSISLLTCSPGDEAYSLYGHTAIRVRNITSGHDVVYNYGTFDQSNKNFVWNFALGHTDYRLSVMPYEYFEAEYREENRSVTEQLLNFNNYEAEALYSFLSTNALPKNCVYRYNYFFDNCTSRSRDAIEKVVRVKYGDTQISPIGTGEVLTFRKIVHLYTQGHPWLEFEQDLLLGCEADVPITQRESMFAPIFMEAYADKAMIISDDDSQRPLVASRHMLLPAGEKSTKMMRFAFTPTLFAIILLAVYVVIWCWESRSKSRMWGADIFLIGLQGIAGIVVSFMFFFSEHPTVGSNWNVLLLNPLPLLYLPREVMLVRNRRKDPYHKVIIVLILLFFLGSMIFFQEIGTAMRILVVTLLCHSIVRYKLSPKAH